MQKTYQEKLKDPRWQKKRLEILNRDEFTCQSCFGSDSTLHVHHKIYNPGKDPWDISNHLLITLCEECHKPEQVAMYEYLYKMLIPILKEKFMSSGVFCIATGFHHIKMVHSPEVTASIVEFALKNEKIMELLEQKYFENLESKKLVNNGKDQ